LQSSEECRCNPETIAQVAIIAKAAAIGQSQRRPQRIESIRKQFKAIGHAIGHRRPSHRDKSSGKRRNSECLSGKPARTLAAAKASGVGLVLLAFLADWSLEEQPARNYLVSIQREHFYRCSGDRTMALFNVNPVRRTDELRFRFKVKVKVLRFKVKVKVS
jgi:hypothetical protein